MYRGEDKLCEPMYAKAPWLQPLTSHLARENRSPILGVLILVSFAQNRCQGPPSKTEVVDE